MSIKEHLDKNKLHHAYLIEGDREEITKEVFKFIESLGIKTANNADVSNIILDSFKIDDARNLKSYAKEKSFSSDKNSKKIFIVSANNFLLEAQNTLLKLFEEPIENTYFFVITTDASALLKTLVSRFYFISTKPESLSELRSAEKFIAMPLKSRMDYIKELLTEEESEDEDGNEIVALDSIRSKSLKFLNALESVLHKKMSETYFNTDPFEHILKVREFLRMPGSSPKTLMESVALITPNFS